MFTATLGLKSLDAGLLGEIADVGARVGPVEVIDIAQIAHAQVQQGRGVDRPVVVKADIILVGFVGVGDVWPSLGIDKVVI